MRKLESQGRAELVIIVKPHRNQDGSTSPEQFDAHIDGDNRVLVTSRQPTLDSARLLIALGHDPGTVLVMRGDNGVESSRVPIGVAARLSVHEEARRSPRFKLWRPFDKRTEAVRDGANDN